VIVCDLIKVTSSMSRRTMRFRSRASISDERLRSVRGLPCAPAVTASSRWSWPSMRHGSSASPRGGPLLQRELNMRLLIWVTAPALAEIDGNPKPLSAQAILLRTSSNAEFDDSWRRRCLHIDVNEIAGDHASLFESANIAIDNTDAVSVLE
jgi:hypothetical protein